VGYAPKDDPQIVVAALWESGEEGPIAAQLVRDVLKAYFDKQARVKQSTSLSQPGSLFPNLRPAAAKP
jgi:penicillin-binding protein 2